MSDLPGKVAVLGGGDIGCGWAALCVSAGWPVTLFDADSAHADRALEEVPRRARALVEFERATPGIVERGVQEFTCDSTLGAAVTGADWVIEAIPEDLALKQNLFAKVEASASPTALLTTSTSGLLPTEVFARCRRHDRCLAAHPLNPPELIPLVELVPSDFTRPESMRRAEGYLRALGRYPITLKRAVPGFVVGRIAAAVWRECIDLVLKGVVEVDQLDRAVSLGPALGWAAGGPHLTYHLGAGSGGLQMFLQGLMTAFESWWGTLAHWDRLEPEQRRALIGEINRAYAGKIGMLREARDRRLAAIVKALEQSRSGGQGDGGQ